jgi:hypothetical protein
MARGDTIQVDGPPMRDHLGGSGSGAVPGLATTARAT